MSERGSVSIVVLAVIAVTMVLGVMLSAVGQYLSAVSRAQSAADAAALAAAPVTFGAFGGEGSPHQEAARFAAANGAALVRCRCPIDRSWDPRTVEVETAIAVDLLVLGKRTARAVARAEFVPVDLLR